MTTSLLIQELEPLNERIEQVLKQRELLASQLQIVQTDLEAFAEDRQRFEALQDVCRALDKLGDLKAGELFWEGIPAFGEVADHITRVRSRIDRFEGEIRGIVEKQTALREQIERREDELDFLHEAVREVYDREERRQEEFVIEREVSSDPDHTMIMPWSKEAESEKRFRRSVLLALLVCLIFGTLIPIIKVPIPDPKTAVIEIPERLAMLVKKEAPKPPPPKPAAKPPQEDPKKEPDKTKPATAEQPVEKPKQAAAPKPAPEPVQGGGGPTTREKVAHVGVLAFKNTFKDLMAETPVARIGTEARLSKESPRVAGQAVAQRSLVAMQAAAGSSGGIGNAAVSRSIGNGHVDGIGGGGIGRGGGNGDGSGSGFVRVESTIADLTETARPLSDGPGLGRTDEEIQIVFDRYKATLYRIYNRELRKDPTLRGKILLRISIETNGAVTLCKVESTDLGSPELVAKIVERIESFNFGPKEGVPKMTILYPIDFLPAG